MRVLSKDYKTKRPSERRNHSSFRNRDRQASVITELNQVNNNRFESSRQRIIKQDDSENLETNPEVKTETEKQA